MSDFANHDPSRSTIMELRPEKPDCKCSPAQRDRLPNRGPSETVAFEHGGAEFTMTAWCYGDGRLGEIFINAGHANSALDALASDAAIVISFALQHGADIAAIRSAMKCNSQGEPSSPIGFALDLLSTEQRE
jgi:hypothetical protein